MSVPYQLLVEDETQVDDACFKGNPRKTLQQCLSIDLCELYFIANPDMLKIARFCRGRFNDRFQVLHWTQQASCRSEKLWVESRKAGWGAPENVMNPWSERLGGSTRISFTAQSDLVMTRSRVCPCSWVGSWTDSCGSKSESSVRNLWPCTSLTLSICTLKSPTVSNWELKTDRVSSKVENSSKNSLVVILSDYGRYTASTVSGPWFVPIHKQLHSAAFKPA